jgi:hypothetical protein
MFALGFQDLYQYISPLLDVIGLCVAISHASRSNGAKVLAIFFGMRLLCAAINHWTISFIVSYMLNPIPGLQAAHLGQFLFQSVVYGYLLTWVILCVAIACILREIDRTRAAFQSVALPNAVVVEKGAST